MDHGGVSAIPWAGLPDVGNLLNGLNLGELFGDLTNLLGNLDVAELLDSLPLGDVQQLLAGFDPLRCVASGLLATPGKAGPGSGQFSLARPAVSRCKDGAW